MGQTATRVHDVVSASMSEHVCGALVNVLLLTLARSPSHTHHHNIRFHLPVTPTSPSSPPTPPAVASSHCG